MAIDRIALVAILLATPAVAATPATMVSGGGVTLKSVAVTFPASNAVFSGGAAADAVNANCVTCHSPSMVLTQPPLSKAVWTEEVGKMRKVYGAAVDDVDVPAIVDYLAALKPAR